MSYKKLLRTITVLAFSCQTALCFAGRDDDLPEPQAAAHQVTVAVPATNVEMPESAGEDSGSASASAQYSLSEREVPPPPQPRNGLGDPTMLDKVFGAMSTVLCGTPAAPLAFLVGVFYKNRPGQPDLWGDIRSAFAVRVHEAADEALYKVVQDELNGTALLIRDFNTDLYRLLQGKDVAETVRSNFRTINDKCIGLLSGLGIGQNDLHKAHTLMPLAVQQGLLHSSTLQAGLRYADILGLTPDDVEIFQSHLDRAVRDEWTDYSYVGHVNHWYKKEKDAADAIPFPNAAAPGWTAKNVRFDAQVACDTFYTFAAFDYSWAFPYFNAKKYPDGAPAIHTLDRIIYQGPVGSNRDAGYDYYQRSHPDQYPMRQLTLYGDTPHWGAFGNHYHYFTRGYTCQWEDGSETAEGVTAGHDKNIVNFRKVVTGPARSVRMATTSSDTGEPVWAINVSDGEAGDPCVPPNNSLYGSADIILAVPDHLLHDIILQSSTDLVLGSKNCGSYVSCVVASFKHQTLGLPMPKWSDADNAYAPTFLGDLVEPSLEVLSIDAVTKIGEDWKDTIEVWFKTTGQANSDSGAVYNFADVKTYVERNWDAWSAARLAYWDNILNPPPPVEEVSAAGPSASAATV